MKLLQRTGQYYIWFSTLIFILWAVGLFLALRYVTNIETDERLLDAKEVILEQLSELESIPNSLVILDNHIEVQPAPAFLPYENFSDTLIWNAMETEHKMAFRKYTYYDEFNGQAYRISINQSILDTEEMLTTIIFAVIGFLVLLLLTMNFFNRHLSLRLWKPFYTSIQRIKEFNFDQKNSLPPPSSKIDEFASLEGALHQMTSKAISDYQSLKQFTENASHEIQNPLAIIKSKIELLMQQDDLNEEEQQAILQIQKAVGRISRLNQSLLMLTRIDNRQYSQTSRLNLKQLTENQLDFVEPLISSKNLAIKTELEDVYLEMNSTLAETLINNLLGNAIKHNLQNGNIDLYLDAEKLKISNSGAALKVPAHQLFERFNKGEEASPSLGLGLAIVKEICNSYGFHIQYEYSDKQHCLTLIL